MKLRLKLYIPIEQRPRIEVPVGCGGTSMIVPPDTGKTFLNFRLGITKDEEQSMVNFVSICRRVGVFALAFVSCGEYPPLATIVIICFPSSSVVTFSVI